METININQPQCKGVLVKNLQYLSDRRDTIPHTAWGMYGAEIIDCYVGHRHPDCQRAASRIKRLNDIFEHRNLEKIDEKDMTAEFYNFIQYLGLAT